MADHGMPIINLTHEEKAALAADSILMPPLMIRFYDGSAPPCSVGPFEQINMESDGSISGGDMARTQIARQVSGKSWKLVWELSTGSSYKQFRVYATGKKWSEHAKEHTT